MKCTHGAAIGQLDEDALFYLRARGLTLPGSARHADPRVRRRHPRSRQDRAARRSRSSVSSTHSWRGISRRWTADDTACRGQRSVLDVARIRADFPILRRQVRGKPLVYLDNAATTQKPQAVLDALVHYYTDINANVHRGVHELSGLATDAVRRSAREDPRASSTRASVQEIVFTRDATEGINLVAYAFVAADARRRATRCVISRDGAPLEHRARGRSSARSAARACGSRRSTTAAS